jgi:hypothetical protein
MRAVVTDMMETPIYGLAEAAEYLRVPLNTLRYWVHGGGSVPPLIKLAGTEPVRLWFANLLECYMLSSMRAIYHVRIPKVRKWLAALALRSAPPPPRGASFRNRSPRLVD